MKIAYCILCHRMTNPLKHTVKYLSAFDTNRLFIHVDLKSDIKPFIEELGSDNVSFVDERVGVAWGNISQVDATLSLLRAAVGEKFDYLFLISGDDIPAVSNHQIIDHLNRLNGYEFVAYQDESFGYVDPQERVKYRYPEYYFKKQRNALEKIKVRAHGLGCRLGVFRNRLYDAFPPLYKGTQWFTITYPCVRFILDYIQKNPAYRCAFQNALCSDELFFHTIIMQSPYRHRIYHDERIRSDSFRYIDWHSGPDYPRTLDESDFEKIKSSAMLFARKIKSDIDMDSLRFFADRPVTYPGQCFVPQKAG